MPIDLAGPRVWRPGQGVFDGPAQQRRARLSGRWQQKTIRDRPGADLPGGWVVRDGSDGHGAVRLRME